MIRYFVATFISLTCAVGFAANHTIIQKDKKFDKDTLTIKVGDSVEFVNADSTPHNVFSSTPGLDFNLGMQMPNAKNPQTFAKAGTVQVRCAIHPHMKLEIQVK